MELKDKQELISILSKIDERLEKLENPQPAQSSEKSEDDDKQSDSEKEQDTTIDDIEKFLED